MLNISNEKQQEFTNINDIENVEGFNGALLEERTLPVICLPGEDVTYQEFAQNLIEAYQGLEWKKRLFLHNGKVCCISEDEQKLSIEPLNPNAACSAFEDAARFVAKDGQNLTATDCYPAVTRIVLEAAVFKAGLPKLKSMKNSPILVPASNGTCKVMKTFEPESGIFATGDVKDVPLKDAIPLLNKLLSDFRFQSDGDRSRAFAAMLTPALTMGKLLSARIPIMMCEAQESQSGKTYFMEMISAIYNETPKVTDFRQSGVGSFDEMFDTALLSEKTMILLDNLRGKLDSPHLESFVTSKDHTLRAAYKKAVSVKTGNYFIMATANNYEFELTRDLANRSSIIRILKQDLSYKFQAYPEKDLVEHVRKNYALYLGAIFAVVKEWVQQGSPQVQTCQHDFREWSQSLDWIVQNILKQKPLMEDHQIIQLEVTAAEDLAWGKKVWECIKSAGKVNSVLTASDIASCCDAGGMELLGSCGRKLSSLNADEQKQVWQQLGRKFTKLFKSIRDNIFKCSQFSIVRKERKCTYDSGRTGTETTYCFTEPEANLGSMATLDTPAIAD